MMLLILHFQKHLFLQAELKNIWFTIFSSYSTQHSSDSKLFLSRIWHLNCLMIFQKSSTQCMQLVTITLTTQLIVIIESREVSATNLSPEALMLEYHPSYAFYEQWEQLFQIDEEVSNVNNDPFIGCFAFFAWVKH